MKNINKTKLSVIIPVYNVQQYLKQCLDSLNIKDNLDVEYILVDDGSTDNSGKICKKYAKRFSSVHVYHQKNGGLSSARNLGIKQSSADWISFIDSDDIVADSYIQIIKRIIDLMDQNSKKDIVIFKFQIFNNDDSLSSNKSGNFEVNRIKHISKTEAYKSLFEKDLGNYAWNKVYSRGLFQNIKYPLRKAYEDIFTTYKLFSVASQIFIYDDYLYFYRQRENSIQNTKNRIRLINIMTDSVEAREEQKKFFKKNNLTSLAIEDDRLNIKTSMRALIWYDGLRLSKTDKYYMMEDMIESHKIDKSKDGFFFTLLMILHNKFKPLYLAICRVYCNLKK